MQAREGAPDGGPGVGAGARWPAGTASIQPLTIGPDSAGVTLEAARGEVLAHTPAPPAWMPRGGRLSCPDDRLQPGRVDAHTRMWRVLAARGMPHPQRPHRDLPDHQRETWWTLARAHDRWSLAASARLFVAEALLAGTTTVLDHHESPRCVEGSLDVLADACQELGMRAVLGYALTERDGGREQAELGLLEARRFLLCNDRSLVRGAVALDAAYNVSDATVRSAVDLAREHGAPLFARIAEDPIDERDAVQRGHEDPLERLAALGAVGPRTVLAPGTFLSQEQVRLATDLGAWLVQTPRASADEGGGYALALGESGRVALGSGGLPSDMRAEAARLSRLALDFGDDRIQVSRRTGAGRDLAAEVLGIDLSLAVGGAADLVVSSSAGVRHVVVGGRVVVRDGELLGASRAAVHAEADDMARRLWGRMRAA